MSYFNHAFSKSFLVTSVATEGTTADLTAAQFGAFDAKTYEFLDLANVTGVTSPFMLALGNYRTLDKVGTHGGYAESIKSKVINPKYVTKLWKVSAVSPTVSTASVSLGSDCAPCGATQYVRLDIKGSPALRFLNRNSYALGDSGSVCCVDGQEYLDPALVLANIGKMLLEDPLVAPFAKEKTGGGITVVVNGGAPATYTIANVIAGNGYTASVDPVGDVVTATLNIEGAYVDTKFGDSSFDTRDFYEKEPVQLRLQFVDETGDPCSSCGTVTFTPGTMQQTAGETVLRELLLTDRYLQSPFNQGNKDSQRIREIEGSDAVISAVDRNALYTVYYLQHSVPRFNNPTSTFDNDQYLYQIFVKSTDTDLIDEIDSIFDGIETAISNPAVTFEELV